jgi:hypothetical protein
VEVGGGRWVLVRLPGVRPTCQCPRRTSGKTRPGRHRGGRRGAEGREIFFFDSGAESWGLTGKLGRVYMDEF